MDIQQALDALKLAREHSKKRNFAQSVDLIINLKGLNLKKPEENILQFVTLPKFKGKDNKIAGLVGNDLQTEAKKHCNFVIHKDEFSSYSNDPRKTKKMAKQFNFFIAQANLMPDIAKHFGKILGPMGKMPNPKAGAVIPSTIPSLEPIVKKLKNAVRIQTKNEQVIKAAVGIDGMKEEDIAENAIAVYNSVYHEVHEDKSKIKSVVLKFSMGRPFVVGKKYSEEELKQPFKKDQKKKVNKQPLTQEEKKTNGKIKKEPTKKIKEKPVKQKGEGK